MPAISNVKILILATDGFEQSELETPRDSLRELGATVHVATPGGGAIKGWDGDDWGDEADADLALADAKADDYDALVLPGGQINPDKLRLEPAAIELIQSFEKAGKLIAAICHAPWLLIEAGLAEGREMTSYESIRTDLANAGAKVVDRSVVFDRGIVTSRKPDDLEDFVSRIVDELQAADSSRSAA